MNLARNLLLGTSIGCGCYLLGRKLLRQSRWFSFQDKVCLVTGGSRGLGLVIARRLIEAKARVAICARTERDLQTAVRELRNSGGDVAGFVCDMRDQSMVERTVAKVIEQWHGLDLLFNIAGVMEVGPLDAMSMQDFREVMEANCWAPLNGVLAVLPQMRKQQWGRIVNVASIGGKLAVPHMIPYDMSKFALVGLSNGLRTELAKDGILVTTACPTLVRTGSQRNVTFKGNNRVEFGWFSIGGALPIMSMSADQAARQILSACQNCEAEVWISNWLNPLVAGIRLAPGLVAEILALINRALPTQSSEGDGASFGYESQSAVSPSVLTQLSDQAAIENNEMSARLAQP